jgi:hypothetical protein
LSQSENGLKEEGQMVTRVLYIDDEIDRPGREARKYKDLLQSPGAFECELQFPPKSFFDIPGQFDAVLIDLDLSVPSCYGPECLEAH